MSNGSNVIPCLRYDNAAAAIDFLCNAFGFSRRAVYADEGDPTIIHHAQLTLGSGMIMLGGAREDETGDLYGWKTPNAAGGITQCISCYVPDPDAHAAHAAAHGAEIIRGPYDNVGYPGRGYDARDPEGNVWNFGNYDPWATPA